jgi:methylated-DNA-[protein]-cysteine S-methyltransferase
MPPAQTPSTYFLHPTPLGDVLIVSSPEGVLSCHPSYDDPGDDLAALAFALGRAPTVGVADAGEQLAAQLDEYFAGRRTQFDLPLDWRLVRGFTREALEAVTRIPFGETASYGEVAVMAGRARAARAVGTACATTPFSIVVPVHRVIRADGSIGEYGGHPETKRFLLDFESGV